MRVLLLHGETTYFGGAQKMLAYFLAGAASGDPPFEPVVAMAPNPTLRDALPPSVEVLEIPSNQRFSLGGLRRQVAALGAAHREKPLAVLHGWTARDWELTAAAGRRLGIPTVGLLHDHPQARAISRSRRALMRLCGRWGLDRLICVSRAVRDACAAAGYPPDILITIHNGIPLPPPPPRPVAPSSLRLGFLGVFTERKGLRALFDLIAHLGEHRDLDWRLALAGAAQDPPGEALIQELTARHRDAWWWSRVEWPGWQPNPFAFLASIDLLLTPSSEFDPFPTVLLEAGAMECPVYAARVGGVPEIIEEGRTGWTFDPQQPALAAQKLAALIRQAHLFRETGLRARERVATLFSLPRMTRDYADLYRSLAPAAAR